MKIAIVINTSWNIFNFRKGLISGLIKDGHQVYAIAPKDKYSENLIDLGVHFIDVDMDSKGTNPFKDFLLIRKLRKVYKTNKIDFALQYTIKPNIFGTIACANINTKTINNISGLGTTFIRQNLVSKIARILYKYALRRADFVFFQNNDDKNLFQKLNLVKGNNIGVLPGSGIPLASLSYAEKDYSNDSKTFLLPCRLLIDKGVGEFIEAARKVKARYGDQIKFVLCGKPENNPTLGFSEEQAVLWAKEGVVDYLGHIDNVIDHIKKSDCVVLPSYREGTPRVLLEAASVGRPIITTDAPGCKEVVIDGSNGYLCKVKDVNSLYHCMIKIIDADSAVLDQMAKKGRTLVESKFDENIVINKYRVEIDNLSK